MVRDWNYGVNGMYGDNTPRSGFKCCFSKNYQSSSLYYSMSVTFGMVRLEQSPWTRFCVLQILLLLLLPLLRMPVLFKTSPTQTWAQNVVVFSQLSNVS